MAEQRTLDAERAARSYLDWWTSIETDIRKSMLVWAHREPERLHSLVKQAYEAGQQSQIDFAARRAPPALDAEELPELPEPYGGMLRLTGGIEPVYTAEQVRQAMRDAVAADRRARRPIVRTTLSPEMKAALEETFKTRSTAALLPGGSPVFINYGDQPEDTAHLSCTACGGSGHIDDQQQLARQSAPEGAPVGMEAATLSDADLYALRRVIECAEKLDERPRPMCRDCADENGTCPNSGLECDMDMLIANAKAAYNQVAAPTSASAQPAEGSHDQRAELPPLTPEEIVAFIGNHYNVMHDAENGDVESIEYELTVHDIQSAFRWWYEDYADQVAAHFACFDQQPAQPADQNKMEKNDE